MAEKKAYSVLPIKVPPDLKRKIRIMAAKREVSMGELAMRLIILGMQNAGAGETVHVELAREAMQPYAAVEGA
jgi:hypothetical protein